MAKANVSSKYGNLKILWHPDKISSFKDNIIKAPIYVRIKPTNRCNHKCYYCSYDPDFGYVLSERFNRNDEIPREKMLEILDDLKKIGVKSLTFSGGGEPLIYSYITEAMKKTLDNGIDLSIITNGQELKDEKAELLKNAKWVRISCDSINREMFEKTRRCSGILFDILKSNIENFAKIKNKNCELGINFVVNKDNCNNVYDAVKFFKELGANHIKITPMYTPRNFLEYHKDIKDKVVEQIKKAKNDFHDDNFAVYDTYENDFSMGSIHERHYNKCFVMQTVPVIGADSSVYFCHDKAYTTAGMLGSLKDKSFKELWFSKEAKEKFDKFNPMIYCQHHCTYDKRNILIHDMLNNFGEHVNFI